MSEIPEVPELVPDVSELDVSEMEEPKELAQMRKS